MRLDVRRQLVELVARYTLEPDLRDIFVEGAFDVSFFQLWASGLGLPNVTVYEIGTVEVPAAVVMQECPWEPDGNRGRVSALASRLAAECPRARATCVIDADFDLLNNAALSRRLPSNLLRTDGSCAEAYLWDWETIAGALTSISVTPPDEAGFVSMTRVLAIVFGMRAVARDLGFTESLPPFTRCCGLARHTIDLDTDDYIARCFNKNAKQEHRVAARRGLDECVAAVLAMPFVHVNGHDLSELVAWYVRQSGNQHAETADVAAWLFAAARWRTVGDAPMLVRLAGRLVNG